MTRSEVCRQIVYIQIKFNEMHRSNAPTNMHIQTISGLIRAVFSVSLLRIMARKYSNSMRQRLQYIYESPSFIQKTRVRNTLQTGPTWQNRKNKIYMLKFQETTTVRRDHFMCTLHSEKTEYDKCSSFLIMNAHCPWTEDRAHKDRTCS